jgi:hypothetical protein
MIVGYIVTRSTHASHPNPVVEAKIVDLRDKFRDAFTGWLEIEEAAKRSPPMSV